MSEAQSEARKQERGLAQHAPSEAGLHTCHDDTNMTEQALPAQVFHLAA